MLTTAYRTWLVRLQVGLEQPQDMALHLFVNDRTPHPDDTANDYMEPQGGGYRPMVLRPQEWTIRPATVSTTADGEDVVQPAAATHLEVTFTFSGPLGVPVVGYFLTLRDTVLLVGAERFEQPRVVQQLGDQEQVTVSLFQR
jgi:hypothetical protein